MAESTPGRTDTSTAIWSTAILVMAFMTVLLTGLPWLMDPGSSWGNDNSAHFALAVHLAEVISAGETNLWWHPSNQGIPLFAAYQPFPGLFSGSMIALLGRWIDPVLLFKATILAPWALMPVAWTIGGRWMGLSRPAALLLGIMTLTIHDPDAIGFGVRSATVRGLYTQHFGLLFLPLAVGAVWRRATGTAQGVITPAALFALLTASHLWVGLYGAIAIGTLLLAEPRRMWPRLLALLPVVALSALILAPWLGPLLATNDLAGGLPWLHEMHNGWPWRKTLSRLVSGAVFDTERWPVLTVLVGVGSLGLTACVRHLHARRWLLLTLITGALFLGRTNLGPLYDHLPLHGQLNVMRYITGIHICGLLAASTALAVFAELVRATWGLRMARGVLLAMVTGLLSLGISELHPTLRSFDTARPEFTELVEALEEGPDTRFVVHERLRTASHFHRDLLPLLSNRGQLQSYAHGFHCTPSTYYAEYFDFSPAAAGLFGAGTVVAKRPLPEDFPSEAWPDQWSNRDYVVARTAPEVDTGLFSFVHIQGRLIAPTVRAFRPVVRALAVPSYARGVLPALQVDPAATSVWVEGPTAESVEWSPQARHALLELLAPTAQTAPGHVVQQERSRSTYTATVVVAGDTPADLMLKVNFFPWWHATVDGAATDIQHVAPNFMTVSVPPGTHTVHFAYRNPPAQKLGMVLSGLVILGWPVMAVARRRRRTPHPA